MYFDKISQAQDLLAKRQEIVEDRPVYEAILQFYSDALVETSILDLIALLKGKKIEVRKTTANTFKDCIYNLLDIFPEVTAAKGMLRYYEAPKNFDWMEWERAEAVLGEALNQDVYGWKPDCWTLFERDTEVCSLTVVFSNGD